MEIIVYSVVVGVLAIMCSILAAKLSEKEREVKELEKRVRKLEMESMRDHRMYIKEKIENIMLRSENGKLCRALFKAYGVEDEGDV